MTLFKKLSFEDESKLESFLSRYPETSMFLRSNLRHSGIEYKGDTPYHGEYFAYCNSVGEIQGIIVHYWNGNIMMQCPDLTVLKELFHYFKLHYSRPICGILGDHIEALGADLSNQSSVESINNAIKDALNRDDLWTLENNGLPLSLCGFNASLPDIVQIGPVWTPVKYRNQGYARAVVALCLLEAKKTGVKQAILFTNNRAAERAYFSIGFKKIGEYRLAILRDKISK